MTNRKWLLLCLAALYYIGGLLSLHFNLPILAAFLFAGMMLLLLGGLICATRA